MTGASTRQPAETENAPRTRRWPRARVWLKRGSIAAVVFIVVFRVSMAFWLVSAVEGSLQVLGLRAVVEDVDLSLLGMDVEVRHLDLLLPEEDGGDEWAHVEYARLDVDVGSLFLFDLRVHRVEVDGLDVRLERDADGRWRLPDVPILREAARDTSEATAETRTEPWSLASPVALDALRLQEVDVHLVDRLREVDTRLNADVRVSDIGHPKRPVRVSVHAFGDLVDRVDIDMVADSAPTEASADVKVRVKGLRGRPLTGLLMDVGLRSVASEKDFDCTARVRVESATDRPLLRASLDVEAARITVDGEPVVGATEVAARARLEPGRLTVEEARFDGAHVRVTVSDEGGVRAVGMEYVAAIASEVSEAAAPTPIEAPVGARPAGTFEFAVDHLEIANARMDLVARGETHPLVLELLKVDDLAPGKTARVHATGQLGAFVSTWQVDATLSRGDVQKVDARVTAECAGIGTLALAASAELAIDGGAVHGKAAVNGVTLRNGDHELVALDRVSIDGIDVGRTAQRIGGVTLRGLRVAPRPGVEITVGADVGALAPGAEVPVVMNVVVADAVDSLRVEGALTLDPAGPSAVFDVDGRGIRSGALDTLLPSGQTIALADGRASAHIEVSTRLDGDAPAALFRISDVALRDGAEGPIEVGVAEVVIDVPSIDTTAGVVRVREFAARGARLAVRRTGDTWRVAGLRIDPSAPAPPVEDAPAPAPTRAPEKPAPPPRIEVERLALGLSELSVREDDGPPVTLRAEVRNVEPLVIVDPEPTDLEPWRFAVEADGGTAMESLKVDLEVAPWRAEPELSVAVEVKGIHGAPVQAALPRTLGAIDLGGLQGAEARVRVGVEMEVARRSATELDLSRGFGVIAELRDASWRAVPKGPVLAGVGLVRIEAPKIRPGSGAVHVAELLVEDIVGEVSRDAAGINVGGVVIPLHVLGIEEAGDGAPAAPVEAAARTAAAPRSRAPMAPVRVDSLVVDGIDFTVRDATTEPPLLLPVDDLSLSVAGFAMGEGIAPSPVRVELTTAIGAVELPRSNKASSALAGFLASTGHALSGGGDEVTLEERPVMGELRVVGALTLGPQPYGAFDVQLSRLELLAFRGPAVAQGVDVGGGVLDSRVKLRVNRDGSGHVDLLATFTDLAVAEPPGGPVSSYLKLPAPLGSVIFVLKNANDEVRVSLAVPVESGMTLGTGRIAGAAAAMFSQMVGEAMLASPFRAAGTVTGLFGGGEPTELPAEASVVVEYQPGAIDVPPGTVAQAEALLTVLREQPDTIAVLRPVLGVMDMRRSELLAMPLRQDRSALAAAMRQRKRELWRRREEMGARARTWFAIGNSTRGVATIDELRALDAEIGRAEAALDRLLTLLRPDAEERGGRRARRIAFELAEARAVAAKAALVEVLVEALGEEAADRVEVRRPRLPPTDELENGVVTMEPRRRKS